MINLIRFIYRPILKSGISQKALKFSLSFRNSGSLTFYHNQTAFSTIESVDSSQNNLKPPDLLTLSQLPPNRIKNLKLFDLLRSMHSSNLVEENFLNKLPKKEASDLINSIEVRLLKEMQSNKQTFILKEYLIMLKFFTRHEAGSIKFYSELEAKIPEVLHQPENQAKENNIRTLGKIIYASVNTNNFNRPYYQALDTHFRKILTQSEEISIQNLFDFTDALHLLSRKAGCSSSLVLSLGSKLSESNFHRVPFEKLINFTWTLLFKTDFSSIMTEKVQIPFQDVQYESVSEQITTLLNILVERMAWKGLSGINTLAPSLKFKLRQIALIIEAIDPKKSLLDPMISALSTLNVSNNGSTNETSLIHDDVIAILRVMKLNGIEKEKQILIFPCDLFLPSNTVIEVNGPSHYVGYNHECKLEDLDGKTLMKYKILLMHQFKVRSISHKEWNSLKGVTNKMKFVAEKIYTQSQIN